MTAADPRRNANGELVIRPIRIGTRSATRSPLDDATISTARSPSPPEATRAGSAARAAIGAAARAAVPSACRSSGDVQLCSLTADHGKPSRTLHPSPPRHPSP